MRQARSTSSCCGCRTTRGKVVGSNFYWLSTKPETLDWEKSNWFITPTSQFADYTALSKLPKVHLKTASRTERRGRGIRHACHAGKSEQESSRSSSG